MVKYGSKILLMFSGEMPPPLSAKVIDTKWSSMSVRMRRMPPRLHRLERVLDHVVERLLELVAIHFQQRQVVPQLLLDEDVAVVDLRLEKGDRLLHEHIDILQPRLEPRRADRAEELLHDRIQPRDLLARDFERLLQVRALRLRHFAQLALHELEMDVQRVERIADLVRHARREQRERGELFATGSFPPSSAASR